MAGALRGIVLRQVDVGEADRIVSLLTEERGRVEARVPRARKSRKRFGGLDLFVLASVDFSPRAGKPRLQEARVLRDFAGIRCDVERLALASHAAELLVCSAPEEDSQPELFRLALAALESLDRPPDEPVGGLGWARGFELKLLHVLGVRPSLRRCAASGAVPAERGEPLWSVTQGGLLCSSMQAQDPRARPISTGVLAHLDEALHRPLSEQAEISWRAQDARGAAQAMAAYVEEHIGARQRALSVLEGLLAGVLCCLLLPACSPAELPTEVRVEGYLFDTMSPGEDSIPVAEAEGEVWDDEGTVLSEIVSPFSDFPGWYRADGLPPNSRVHLRFGADGAVTTVLTGWTASDDLFVDPGSFHLWTRDDALSELAFWTEGGVKEGLPDPRFDPGVAEEGGVVFGQLAFGAEHVGTQLVLVDAEGTEHLARGTDAEGRPQATHGTGEDGRFAALGLPPGPLSIRIVSASGEAEPDLFQTWVAEDAVTSLPNFVLR